MLVDMFTRYLDRENVKYRITRHPHAFTAQEIAETAHISGKYFAKTVIVRIEGKLAMLVLTAHSRVDFDLLAEAFNAHSVELVSEGTLADVFPDCELGAMPPFGNLYRIPVYVSKTLAEDKEITFNAGTHTDLITLAYEDFEWLVSPQIIPLDETKNSPAKRAMHCV